MPVYPAEVLAPGDPGEEIESAFQYQFKDLLFGSGTPYIVTEVTGLLAMPGVTDHDKPKGYDHGANPGIITMNKRIIAFNIGVIGSAGVDIEQKIATASRVFQLPRLRRSKTMEPLVFQRPGQVMRQCFVRCTKRDFTSNFQMAKGLGIGSVEFQATDPRIYSLDEYTTAYTLTAGLTSGTFTVNTVGDFVDGTYPTVEIAGPATNPTIGNLDDDSRYFKLNVILTAVDAVRVDFKNQRIYKRTGLAGAWVEDFSMLANDSKWWAILPGINDLQVTRQAGNTAGGMGVTVTFRDVWQ